MSFHNPSIRDYVARRIANDKELILALIDRASFFDQVSCLIRLDENGEVQFEPAGRVGDCETLRHAIRRTLLSGSPIIIRERSSRSDTIFWQSHVDFGSRLSSIARWTGILGATWLELPCEVAKSLDIADFAKIATPRAGEFVEALIGQSPPEGGEHSSLVQRFLTEIGGGMVADGRTADNWSEWSWLIHRNGSLFSEEALEDWRDRAYTFCRNQVDIICDNAESTSRAEDEFGQVKQAARAWGFSLDGEQKRFDKWLAERDGRGEDDDDWAGSSGRENPEIGRGGTNRELDALFGSLTDRDR